MIGTVQFRLTVLATAVVAVTLVVSAVGLVAVQRALLTRGIAAALTQRADNISADVARGRLGPEPPSEGDPEDSFLQVLDRTGRVVSGTADARGIRPVVTPLAPGSRTVIRTLSGVRVGSDEFRVLARRVRA